MPHPRGGYKLKDGSRVPGTTTIISRFKDSAALLYWACEQGKAIERGEISKLYDKRDQAADAGTIAHAMVEAHLLKKPIPETDNTQAKQGFDNYLRWEKSSNIEIIDVEIQLVSESHRFGGCLDAIFSIDGKLAVGDFKTSNAIYADHLIQIAAYKILWNENNLSDPITGGFHLLRFSKDHADFAHHFWNELEDAESQFLLFRKAYDLDQLLSKRL